MAKKLYIGNLPFSATEDEIRDLFSPHGSIESLNIVTDRVTGRSRGFAFIEMDGGDADNALQALNGTEMDGRKLNISEARERGPRDGGGGGRGGRGGGGGGRRF